MSDVNCPYCNKEIEICHDDGHGLDEDKTHQDQCPHCEKHFVFTTSISIDHYAEKADCLNGADHQWEPARMYPQVWLYDRCKVCGDETPKRINPEFNKPTTP